jgi:cellobiose transport system substrate-binding protein
VERFHARRSRIGLVAVLIAATAIASGLVATGASASRHSNITLTIDVFGDFGYHALYQQYMASHPGITIKEDSEDYAPHHTALAQHLATGAGADDIEAVEVGFIALYTSQPRYFADLRKYGAAKVKKQYLPWKYSQAVARNGSVIGLGTDVGSLGICYRTDLFKKAGLPTSPAKVGKMWNTWSDFLAVGKKFQKRAPAGVKFIDSGSNLYNAIVGQANPAYYSKSGKVIATTNPKVKQAWNLTMQSIKMREDKGLSAFSNDWNTGFKTGTFATVTCPAWMMGYIQGQAPATSGKWNIATVPGGGGNWGGSYLAIPKASKHQQAAYDLIKWLTAPEQQIAMWKAQQHFPSSSTAASDPSVAQATDTYFGDAPIGTIFNESATKLVVPIIGPKDGAIKNAFSQGLVAVEQQGKDPAKAWNQTMSDIDAVVNG